MGACVSFFSVTVLSVCVSADREGKRDVHFNLLHNHRVFCMDWAGRRKGYQCLFLSAVVVLVYISADQGRECAGHFPLLRVLTFYFYGVGGGE